MDAVRLAKQFSSLLATRLGIQRLIVVCQLNQSTEQEGLCASHSFCDAWGMMSKAFKIVTGKNYDPRSKEDFMLTNTAWEVAKQNHFFVSTRGAQNLPSV